VLFLIKKIYKQILLIILFLTNCNIKAAYFTQEPKFEEVKIFTDGDSYQEGDGSKSHNLDLDGGAQWDYLHYKLVEQRKSYEDLLVVYKLSHDGPWYDLCQKYLAGSLLPGKNDFEVFSLAFNSKKKFMELTLKKFLKEKAEKEDKKTANMGCVDFILKKTEDKLTDYLVNEIVSAINRKTEKKQIERRKEVYMDYEKEVFIFATKQGNFYVSIFGKLVEEGVFQKVMKESGMALPDIGLDNDVIKPEDDKPKKVEDVVVVGKNVFGKRIYFLGVLFLSGLYFIFSHYIF
jgi:hypothetical protein